ncbi:MAG: response regulator [Candidatus Wallbacteria bacterium]|nr:response regulator [Candidatus Wallbacteria bacterium]
MRDASQKKDGSAVRFMIVDDSSFMIRELERFIRAMNCTVAATASSGEQAVEKYPEIKPDIVTMDISMPGMNGLEALTRILELDPRARVVMISGLGHENMVRECISAGAAGFLVKPLAQEQFEQTLMPILAKFA